MCIYIYIYAYTYIYIDLHTETCSAAPGRAGRDAPGWLEGLRRPWEGGSPVGGALLSDGILYYTILYYTVRKSFPNNNAFETS